MHTNPNGANAPEIETHGERVTRRRFVQAGSAAAALVLGGTAVGGIRYMFPNVLYEPPNTLKAGNPTDFADGTVTYFAEKNVFVRKAPQGFMAISAVCAHLGCTVSWHPDKDLGDGQAKLDGEKLKGEFHCPCHGSVYTPKGEILAGPAPRGLDVFQVSIAKDGQLMVDLGAPATQRNPIEV